MIDSAADIRFTSLFEEHHRAVLAYFLRRLDREAANEATADVYVVVWRRMADVPAGDETLPWLYGVCRRVLSNRLRSNRRADRLVDKLTRIRSLQTEAPDTVIIQRAEDQAIISALATLRPQDQELLRLAYWEEVPHAANGELVGCSRKTADVRIHRAVRRLRQAFTQAGHKPDKGQVRLTASEEQEAG
ncbi:MAG: sigma-70 family RNA polymerase sigma factor [Acidimicrobiia bacterium]